MAKKYIVAENTGKGFITHEEKENKVPLIVRGLPANVWEVENNSTGQTWIAKVKGVSKTKAQAQSLINTEVKASQDAWDSLPDDSYEKEPPRERPYDITL
tara:strand:+ start:6720 stop:7019 length:300 start_codon:yes stop_codon:yes gene_type:complete